MNSLRSEKSQIPLPSNEDSLPPATSQDAGAGIAEHPAELVGETHPVLPPYSGPSQASSSRDAAAAAVESPSPTTKLRTYPGLPKIDYTLYAPQFFDLSSDSTTLSTKTPHLSSSASALLTLIRSLASVPPKPLIRIVGKRSAAPKADFDLKINLMGLIIPDDPALRMDYIRCVGEGETAYRGGVKKSLLPDVDGGLEEWCRRFVEDESPVKTFTLERVVANLDTEWMDGRLRSMIASTQYKGVVDISYPIAHSRVVVQSPDKVNKFFTSVTSFFSGKKRYGVVQSVWPFATTPKGDPSRRCIVQGEEDWWREWRDAIKHALSMKRVGWVTNEDRLEVLMEGKGKGVSSIDWETVDY